MQTPRQYENIPLFKSTLLRKSGILPVPRRLNFRRFYALCSLHDLLFFTAMNDFRSSQLHHVGPGGIKCSCCNRLARKGDNADRRLNRMARAKVRELTRLLIKNDEFYEASRFLHL